MSISIAIRPKPTTQKFVFILSLFGFFHSASISQEMSEAYTRDADISVHVDTLENGLRLISIADTDSTRVFWSIEMKTPLSLELERTGVAQLTGDIMRSGTALRPLDSLDLLLDAYDAEIITSQGLLHASCPKAYAQQTLALLVEVLRYPAFTETAVNGALERYRLTISTHENSSEIRAHQLSLQRVFTKKHPYGETISPTSLDSISQIDLIQHHAQHYRPQYTSIAVTGDLPHEEIRTWIEAALGDWLPREIPIVRHSAPIKPLHNRVCFGEIPGEQRMALELSHTVSLKPGHSDEAACVVLNALLTHPILPGILIDTTCLTPPCSPNLTSHLLADHLLGSFRIQSLETPNQVIPFIEKSIASMQELALNRVDEELIQSAVEAVIADMQLHDAEKHLEAWHDAILYREDSEGPHTFMKALQAVTPSDIQRVAIQYLRPANLIIAIAGDRLLIPEGLNRFSGHSEIEFFDALGKRVLQLDPAPVGETAETVFLDYYTARGGSEAFETLESLVQIADGTAGSEMKIDVEIKTKYGVGILTQVSMNGNLMIEQIITKSGGINRMNGESKALPESEFKKLSQNLYAAHFLHLTDLNLTAELLGM
ncbi:MAG: insulinase family protein, partial [Flavobacteriales bacterium]|nr:insulinase family protein [Flavobacteriales bacterium]